MKRIYHRVGGMGRCSQGAQGAMQHFATCSTNLRGDVVAGSGLRNAGAAIELETFLMVIPDAKLSRTGIRFSAGHLFCTLPISRNARLPSRQPPTCPKPRLLRKRFQTGHTAFHGFRGSALG